MWSAKYEAAGERAFNRALDDYLDESSYCDYCIDQALEDNPDVDVDSVECTCDEDNFIEPDSYDDWCNDSYI